MNEFDGFTGPSGEKTLCRDWFILNYKILGQGLAIAVTMAVINVIVEVSIGLLSEYFNRPRNF